MKKIRLVVPAITPLLSASLLTGFGYALSSSISNTDNNINIEGTEINLCNDGDAATITYPAFSNGRITYQHTDDTYKIRENQDVFLSDDMTYIGSTHKGDISISMNWSLDVDIFKNIKLTIGNKSVDLNHQNSFFATFTGDNSVDTSAHLLKVTMKGTTGEYNSTTDPTGLIFSVKFTLMTMTESDGLMNV